MTKPGSRCRKITSQGYKKMDTAAAVSIFYFTIIGQGNPAPTSSLIVVFFLLDLEDCVNLFHDLRGDLRGYCSRLHIFVHLFHTAGTGDDRADEWILQT